MAIDSEYLYYLQKENKYGYGNTYIFIPAMHSFCASIFENKKYMSILRVLSVMKLVLIDEQILKKEEIINALWNGGSARSDEYTKKNHLDLYVFEAAISRHKMVVGGAMGNGWLKDNFIETVKKRQ